MEGKKKEGLEVRRTERRKENLREINKQRGEKDRRAKGKNEIRKETCKQRRV